MHDATHTGRWSESAVADTVRAADLHRAVFVISGMSLGRKPWNYVEAIDTIQARFSCVGAARLRGEFPIGRSTSIRRAARRLIIIVSGLSHAASRNMRKNRKRMFKQKKSHFQGRVVRGTGMRLHAPRERRENLSDVPPTFAERSRRNERSTLLWLYPETVESGIKFHRYVNTRGRHVTCGDFLGLGLGGDS